eukprot:3082618-Lingulodinium_polyedra.AAC.1
MSCPNGRPEDRGRGFAPPRKSFQGDPDKYADDLWTTARRSRPSNFTARRFESGELWTGVAICA